MSTLDQSKSHFIETRPCPKCREKGHDRKGNNLAVYSDNHGYCFSCGWLCTVRNDELVASFTLPSYIKENEAVTYENGMAWLSKYGITHDEIKAYQIKVDKFGVEIPVFRDGHKVGSSTRVLIKGSPKYISKFNQRRELWDPFKVQSIKALRASLDAIDTNTKENKNKSIDVSGTLVLVEDCLSAIKIARLGYASLPLLSSNIHENLLKYTLNKGYAHVLVWLDADKREEAIRLQYRCSSLEERTHSTKVRCIFSSSDPKSYSMEDMGKIIFTP